MQTTSLAGLPASESIVLVALPNAGAQAVVGDPQPYSPACQSRSEAGGPLGPPAQRSAASLGWMRDQLADDGSYVSRLLLGITGRLVRLHAVRHSDRDDFLQAIRLDLLRRWTWYKPSHSGEKTFATRLVRNAIGAQLRAGRRRKRHTTSLSGTIADEQSVIDLVTEQSSRGHRGLRPRDEQLTRERHVDLAAACDALPDELALICRLLRRLSPTETAAKLGITRSSLYRRLREIADHLEDRGLAEYLET
jgi:RNA polymerase sigma factor (sigma-70 family)